ncbi:MAG TPA: hypothetical protein VFS62_08585 [Chloroflexota bacterium]|nr:hypothetical protein [Chloroflexota bacterium]
MSITPLPLEKQIAFIDAQIQTYQSGPPHLGMNRALAISTLRKRQALLVAALVVARPCA